ncbi:MAG: MBOAT family O-acyltransferase [Myxococcota bacterium]
MVFTSLDYAILLCATAVAYWTLPARLGRALLLVASMAFYAFWSVPFLGLLLAATGVGWSAGLFVERARRAGRVRAARAGVAVAAVVLLGILATFKYADLGAQIVAALVGGAYEPLLIVLPLAISFYTFQILGYVVDVQRGFPAERNALRFTLFVAFFPQLVAGPIARAHQLLPQLRARAAFDGERVLRGLRLLAYGVIKKSVFADNLGVYVDRVYGDPTAAGGLDVVLATLAFGAQIYCDFSGYTDIARGSGRMLGIELPENFRSPYAASSLAEFWRRWHVTLSTWLRDYLYIPLGGSRHGPARTAAALLATMTLGGLWHGAAVTFLLWGAYHGVLLVVERFLVRPAPAHEPRGLAGLSPGVLPTFLLVQVGWALFRAEDMATLAALGRALVETPLGTNVGLDSASMLPLVVLAYALHFAAAAWRSHPPRLDLARPALSVPVLTAAVLLVVVFGGASDAFIYFQF